MFQAIFFKKILDPFINIVTNSPAALFRLSNSIDSSFSSGSSLKIESYKEALSSYHNIFSQVILMFIDILNPGSISIFSMSVDFTLY